MATPLTGYVMLCPCLGLCRVTSAAVLHSTAHVNWSRLRFIGSVLSYDTTFTNPLLELFCLLLALLD